MGSHGYGRLLYRLALSTTNMRGNFFRSEVKWAETTAPVMQNQKEEPNTHTYAPYAPGPGW